MYPHVEFGIPASKNIGDMLQTRIRLRWTDTWRDALTFGVLLGTYNVRKSSQESISTQQIPVNFYGINLILSLLAPFIHYSVNDFWKFKVPNKGPFVSTDGLTVQKLYAPKADFAGIKTCFGNTCILEEKKSFYAITFHSTRLWTIMEKKQYIYIQLHKTW